MTDAMLVDTARPIVTPEGARLTIRVAGPQVRLGAWLYDLAIRMGAYLAFAFVAGLLGEVGVGLFLLFVFASEWLYFVVFEGTSGATPGKRRFGLRVVRRDGAPCGLEAACVRNLVRFVDALPPLYGFGLCSVLASPEFQRLGDRAAGTLVVYGRAAKKRSAQSARARRKASRSEENVEAIEPVPPPVALSGEEEAALLEFRRRSVDWSQERQIEVAARLEPLTNERGERGRVLALGYAAWLDGHRAADGDVEAPR